MNIQIDIIQFQAICFFYPACTWMAESQDKDTNRKTATNTRIEPNQIRFNPRFKLDPKKPPRLTHSAPPHRHTHTLLYGNNLIQPHAVI